MSWYGSYDDGYDDYDGDYDEIEVSPDALVITGPVRAVSRRGDIGSTWWGQQWVAAMLRLGDARLDRGKSYARNGKVRDLTIQHGIAFSYVQGHYSKPYQTSVELKTFTDKEWEKALDALAGQAIYAAKLLAGEMPGDIEGVFQGIGLSLFPRSRKDISFDCSCPDWGDPCKHAAAVYYLVAEQLDVDPFILFHLRGYTRERVLDGLRRRRVTSTASEESQHIEGGQRVPALDDDLTTFWIGSPSSLVRSAPVVPAHPPLLAQLGDPPGGTGKELEGIYARVSQVALTWLGREEKITAERPDRTEEIEKAFEYIQSLEEPLFVDDIQDIPLVPEREKRFEAILVDAYGPDEELVSFEVYLSDALQTPFKATWRDPDEPGHKESVIVLGVDSLDNRRGVLLSVKRANKTRRIVAEQVWADKKGVNATVLDDYRYWVDHYGGPMNDDEGW
jgi:uncharacterized Zn finger protein